MGAHRSGRRPDTMRRLSLDRGNGVRGAGGRNPRLRTWGTFAAGFALVLAAGCSGGDGDGDGGSDAPPPIAETATFDRIQSELFDKSCATSSCHSDIARAANLVLS